MSRTMSSTPPDWSQFYPQNPSSDDDVDQLLQPFSAGPPAVVGSDGGGGGVSDATAAAVATTVNTSSSHQVMINSGSSGGLSARLSPEGGVSKPVRRRSRASRRTPTTLLNTDTANFRAMVQQFTGGPSLPFAASGSVVGGGGPQITLPNTFSFAPPSRRQVVDIPSRGEVMGGAGYHHQLQYQIPQQQQQSQAPSPYMFSFNNSSGIIPPPVGGGGDVFLQRLGAVGNPRPASMEGAAGLMVTEGISVSSLVAPTTTTSAAAAAASRGDESASSNQNQRNSFLF
ncbi:hypothetical protein Tsubulata_024223 [Turnera subulata]|uniref:VQ domain-containing protein n=1 Tax=Turnera subulata TaxID=218843 RepID=A0A9Q0JK69_9ROSI|nr:hypothetical protein Tsubulata_024223 [Turnera subulata]